jgi:tetratricopeptide (TPR) repeat protein
MKKLIWAFLPLLLILQVACNNEAAYENTLKKLEADLQPANGVVTDVAKAKQYIETSEKYAELVKATKPDKYVELLLKAAALAKEVKDYNKSIELYNRIADQVPQHQKAPVALFMTGFIYENDLNDLVKAKAVYEKFLQKYPNEKDLANSAEQSIKLLGKPLDEIIKGFNQDHSKEEVK